MAEKIKASKRKMEGPVVSKNGFAREVFNESKISRKTFLEESARWSLALDTPYYIV